jgi:hypothetical protein
MMADLMDEDMADDGAQRLFMLGPVIENGTPVEEDHIGERAGMRELLRLSKTHALEQPEQVELALGLHVGEHFVLREILNPDDDIAGKVVKGLRQARIGLFGQRVKFLERWRFEAAQLLQRKPVTWQRSIPWAVMAFTVV